MMLLPALVLCGTHWLLLVMPFEGLAAVSAGAAAAAGPAAVCAAAAVQERVLLQLLHLLCYVYVCASLLLLQGRPCCPAG